MYCCVLMFFVILVTCNTQDYSSFMEDENTLAADTLTESQSGNSTLICETCQCSDDVVDCTGLGISRFFEFGDWQGLASMAPKEVDLSNNHLVLVTRMPDLPIQTLNLSSCDIEEIEQMSFRNLEDLETLDLSRNKLMTSSLSRRMFEGKITFVPGPDDIPIPTSATPFPKMKYLSLADNGIHSLPQDLFVSMVSITTLDLSGNPLAYIDAVTMAAITELTKLTELRLSSCELETLPEGLLRRQRRLERLDLSDNRFTTVPSILSEASNLLFLNLNKNPIASLEDNSSISSLKKLQELRLCRLSKLQNISARALGCLEQLMTLRICNNPRLTNLDPAALMWEDDHDVQRYPTLSGLYLNNNNLSEINSHLLLRWDTLKEVDFTNNPFVCDCSNQWMVDVLVPVIRGTAVNATVYDMICSQPPELRGMSFGLLRDSAKTLACPPEELALIPTPDMAIMLGIMIGIFTTFPIVLVLVLLWRNGYFSKCRGKIEREKDYEEEEENL